MRLRTAGKLKILDFDIENRPLTYMGGDFTSAEVTSIAAGFMGSREVAFWAIDLDGGTEDMLTGFKKLYDEADMVTGHYIRKHDLPIVNGAYLEAGLETLGAKLSSDTCLDLVKRKDLSRSQEALAGMFGLSQPKVGMSQTAWRAANRLSPEGLEGTRKRCVGDVRQHKQLREHLVKIGALKSPRTWHPL